MKMNKIAGGLLALCLLVGPVFASANSTNTSVTTSTNTQIQALLEQIKSLQAQVLALQTAQKQVATARTEVSDSVQLIRNLKEGMSGDDIAALQAMLASDPSIFPNGTVDGIFGSTTREALKKFQKKHGYDQVGYVGPKTLKQLNKLMKELGFKKRNDKEFCVKVPPGHLIAPGLLKMDDNGKKEGKYKFRIVECDKITNGNGGGNNTSSTTPWISNTASNSVAVGGTIYDRATLSFGKEPTGTVSFQVYGPGDTTCTTPLSPAPSSATVNGNGTYTSGNFTTNNAGTYRFTASYSGDSKNKPVSTACNASGSTVNVTALADTSAPVISLVGTSNLLGTTTSVTWSTNENSNSRIWYGTSSPVVTSGVANLSDAGLVTSHSLALSGLATSTTYYFVVASTDSAGNTATSSQGSFVTTAGL